MGWDPEALALELDRTGALLKGHFLLTSGRHSRDYIEKFRLLEKPQIVERICAEWKRRFERDGISLVAGPAVGGIVLAYELARQIGCRYAFTEGTGHDRFLGRGFAVGPGDSVLLVDDVVTTGGSLKATWEAIARTGARVVGAGIVIYRGSEPLDIGVRTEILLTLPLDTFDPETCPLCRRDLPLVRPGKPQD